MVSIPQSIKRIIEASKSLIAPEKVILFGSIARGDARKSSDYDILFYFDESKRKDWAKLQDKIEAENLCLLPVDLVASFDCCEKLKQIAEKEGITLYERQ